MTVKKDTFKVLRQAHHREKAEDYVEVIHKLMQDGGEARLTDIARHFSVTTVTAHKIIARLQRENFILSKPYRAIFLTPKGKKLAEASQKRHEVVYQFLKFLGVSDKVAQVDAEGIEHHVSPETLQIFKKTMKRKI